MVSVNRLGSYDTIESLGDHTSLMALRKLEVPQSFLEC
jgi:hypothetical protein